MQTGRIALGALQVFLLANAARASHYQIEDAVPPDASGAVTTFSGDVRSIVGVETAVAGKVDPLAATLKDLGARVSEQEIRIEMSADVLFDFDKAVIKPAAGPSLAKVATVLEQYPRAAVNIEGHTDAKGSETYNQKLSERRARAVQDWLKRSPALSNVRISTQGFGARKPVAPNRKPDGSDDTEGRQKNRRVEIVVRKN